MSAPIFIALIHYPVLNKHGEIVTTSITNFDIHDLARTSRTYGVEKCFLVTPNEPQQSMVQFIRSYWQQGFGATYNPDRKEAFDCLELAKNLEETCLTIQKRHGIHPRLIATTARFQENSLRFKDLRKSLQEKSQPYLLMFGTGWGLAPEILSRADAILEPIRGPSDYNHLPVRSAVAVVLDRLLGNW